MRIRRPIAALMTALALFGGGATMTACGEPTTENEGTTDDDTNEVDEEDADRDNLPDNSNPEPGQEDDGDDTQDPD
jgi:hypothetical protein